MERVLFERDGFAVVPSLISRERVESLIEAVAPAVWDQDRRGGRRYARRNLLLVAAVRELAESREVRGVLEQILGPQAFAVRGLLFDKTRDANWKVPWHQDLAIAVQRKAEMEGFGPWSLKAGVVHVQPPRWVLEQMVTVRVHVDDCDEGNGPLRVVPGSHRDGVLSGGQIAERVRAHKPVALCTSAGGAVVMRPLLLHASSAAVKAAHRRVIHLEFAGVELPEPLRWRVA